MRKGKKIISLLVSVVMILSLFSVNVMAATTEYDISTSTSDVKAVFDSSTGILTISGSGSMMGYSSSPFGSNKTKVTKVVFAEGSNATQISSGIFNGMTNLKSIEIPNSITSIGEKAFYNCSSLTEIIIPEGVTIIGEKAFYSCSSVTTVSIPSTVDYIWDEAFNMMPQVNTITSKATVKKYGANAFGTTDNLIGKSTTNKVATVPASEIYMQGALETYGFEVKLEGTATEEEKWASYPADNVIDLSADDGVSNVKAYYNDFTKQIDIVGTGATKDYQEISGETGFGSNKNMILNAEKIKVHEGITRLGSYLFIANGSSASSCSYLSNVRDIKLPSTLRSIGSGTFKKMNYNKGYMVNLVIPEGVTTISSSFSDAWVVSIVLPSTLTSMSSQGYFSVYSTIINNSKIDQTFLSTVAKSNNNMHVYLYSSNTTMLERASTMTAEENIHFLDEPALSGTLDNGITWVYDPDTKTISFDTTNATSTEIPNYSAGRQPWASAFYNYGAASRYDFGGVSGIGSSSFAGFDYGGIGFIDYYGHGGASGFGSTLSAQTGSTANYGGVSAGGQTGGGTETEKTGIEVFVDNVKVNFPDAQPFISDNQVLAPLRFIEQDLNADVYWKEETQEVLIRIIEWEDTENERQVDVVLTVGGTTMKVNGKEYTSEELDLGVAVLLKDNRCFLPGEAIVKAWESVSFSKDYSNAPTYYADYYNILTEAEDALPSGDEFEDETEYVDITPDNEEDLLYGIANNFDTAIIVTSEATTFKVSVPIRIDAEMDKDGIITTGTGYTVDNECPMGPIIINNIKVVSRTDWTITDFNADYKNMKASSNAIGMTINDAEVQTNGAVTLNESLSSVIRNKGSKDLSFEVKMPAQKKAITENVLAIVFTIDFDKV